MTRVSLVFENPAATRCERGWHPAKKTTHKGVLGKRDKVTPLESDPWIATATSEVPRVVV